MKAKIIIILVLLAIAGFVLFSMSPDQQKKDEAGTPTPDGNTPDPYKAIVTQLTWEPGQPAPDGWQIVTDTRTGAQNIRPISTR